VTKSDMIDCTCKHLNKPKAQNIPVWYIRFGPAGETHKLVKHAGSSDWAVLQPFDFEFTSQDTPQHNSLAKLAFPYLAGTACAMMGDALVSDDMCSKLH